MDIDIFHQLADTLLSGRYSLLIGAGASLDSKNGGGDPLPSGRAYLQFLSDKKKLPAKYALQDVYSMVTDAERDAFVTRLFQHCIPGPTVTRLTDFIWTRVFSFNIDDAFEAACERLDTTPQQRAIPIHFKDPYIEPRKREELHVIHLHGTTRRAEDGYIFSKDEYVRLIKTVSPWMTILSQFIRSEPFIVAGTSLDEIDLHFYLSFRDAHSNDNARAPSILIEPFPDAMTEHRCKLYGLTLFRGTILEFFALLSG
jgi:SIR2-like domain